MHSFLNNIADAYAADPDLSTYTFVFPNVRAKRYFAQCLEDRGIDSDLTPRLCITLQQLTELGSGLKRTPTERLMFLLYKAYQSVMGMFALDFDKFYFWGLRVLQDFNDVDHYMADPKEIFRNAKDYKEIHALYLTDAQKRIIEKYWGGDPYWRGIPAESDANELPLWNHVKPNGAAEKKFIQLWEMLGPLYVRFHQLLNGESYPGMAAKKVAESLMHNDRIGPFNPRKFIFIGFNRLTTAETIIFEKLQELGKAHFYWDFDAELMNHQGNPAGRFIRKYAEHFTSCKPNVLPPSRPTRRRVDVIGVPSAVGQAKVMAERLEQEESAIILPDSEMLLPVVASIPKRFEDINVTMGYPMRFSAISQLFDQLVSLQIRTMDYNGDTLIFRDDVRAIITNPLVQAAFNEQCRWVDDYMRRESLFNLPASRLSNPGFGPLATLFAPLGDDASIDDLASYVTNVMSLASHSGLANNIDAKCCDAIAKKTQQIVTLAHECDVTMQKRTFFSLIEHTLFQRTVPLEGEKFEALQVMGVLETRAMGFPSVMMLSMTDSIFPGRQNTESFIPEVLRHAYGLPTRDHSDVDNAYHFYHILSAAEHLTLIYDARVGALASGEMSRYIHQLRHLEFPSVEVKMYLAAFNNEIPAEREILISPELKLPKTHRVMDKINRYLDPSRLLSASLSASALKEFIHCPAEFYFNRVERICPDSLQAESMDAAEYGSVVHEVADRVYSFFKKNHGGMVTAQMLTSLLDGGFDGMLERELTRAINLCRNRFPDKIDGVDNPALFSAEIVGEAAVYRPTLLKNLHTLFSLDRDAAPFEIIDTELNKTFSWPITVDDRQLTVNFTMKIDRIDRIVEDGKEVIRLIDYKTGSDCTSFTDVNQLFDYGNPEHPKAIFQLFTYCAAYAYLTGIDPMKLRPQVFALKNPAIAEFPLITCQDTPVLSYGTYHQEFIDKLATMFSDLFDQNVPFQRSDNDDVCRFCRVYSFCHKEDAPPKMDKFRK